MTAGRGKALAFIQAEHAAGRPFPKRAVLALATGLKQTAVADLLDALLIAGYLKRGERARDGHRAYTWELVK